MKHFVINLERRSDRLEWWKEENDYLKNYTVFKAFDAKDLTYPQLLSMGYDINKAWRGGAKNNRLTNGEIGCFLSHYKLWEACAKQNEPFYICEDDIKVPQENYNTAVKYIDSYDFIHIGWVDSNNREPQPINDDLCTPVFPWNLSAYILTPKAAKTLISSNITQHIIPADEYVPRVLNANVFTWAALRNADVKGFVTESDVSLSGLNTTSSNAEIFKAHKVHAITIGTDESKCETLFNSADRLGFTITNIGKGVVWNGTDMSGPGGGQKINMIRTHLHKYDDEDIVLFTDGYDTFYSASPDLIYQRYLEFNCEIVFAAEKDCWPDATLADRFNQEEVYPYLNSGCFIGTVKELKKLFVSPLGDKADDQLYIHHQYLQGNYNIKLDYGQYIFMTMDQENLIIQNGDTFNKKVRTYGCVVHGNGPDSAKRHFNKLFRQISSTESPLFIRNYGKFDIIHDDMLLVNFMTKDQCDRLIEISDNHGGWEPLPGDKFPAYEIRMKELGLFEEVEQYWINEIYPVIEDYWHPLKMYGLRDAFTMRYSLDTQTSLNNHHDASLVTGSVKLNDSYEGAKLIFPRQGVTNDVAEVGQCILFPGQVTHGHYCNELTSGVKYSLTMWTSRYDGDVN